MKTKIGFWLLTAVFLGGCSCLQEDETMVTTTGGASASSLEPEAIDVMPVPGETPSPLLASPEVPVLPHLQGIDIEKASNAGSLEDFIVNVGDRAFFGFDKSSLSSASKDTLKKQAEWLKKYPDARATLEGHCDARGTVEYNLALGERRATAAKKYLNAHGIDADRVSVVSYGKERPIVSGTSEEAYAQNRVAVTKPEGLNAGVVISETPVSMPE